MSDTFPVEVDNDRAVLQLEAILDMSVSEPLLEKLRHVVAEYDKLTLDAGAVKRVSTPCIQVILATALKIEKAGGDFSVKNISAGFERGMQELGLRDYLKKWSRDK